MKYFVTIDGRERVVEVAGDQVTLDGASVTARLEPVPGTPMRQLVLDGNPITLTVERLGPGRWRVGRGGLAPEVEVLDERLRHIRSLTGVGARQGAGGILKAPMPGLVVRVEVEPGQQVTAGAPLVVLEAMKMENQLAAPAAGTVTAVRVQPGATVEKGAVLVEIVST
ncbi:MAG TPA: biotin/lipoyl-containing protein [Gemmatimonadales bacterium]|nr:biotin/lipoyl-containing protein [Gemmatimonadales bacterium]